MSLELIYTSAPQGLKPGSRGFCTVVSTQGMPPILSERLESLSGYRHVYSPQDPLAGLNPVACSHLRLTAGARRFHVLSRISAAGLDYTQRTNKFAHHVALDPSELPSGGPAWLLALPGFMQTDWDGRPTTLSAGRAVPVGDGRAAVCQAWQQLTGDAGWGGVLAEAAATAARRPAYLIFKPGLDPLPLLVESLALLPSRLRWNVSFSTYFTRLPAGIDCQWRCVLQGSPEAAAAKGSSNHLIIDLCNPLPAPPAGAYIDAARTGTEPAVPVRPRPRAGGEAYRASEGAIVKSLAQERRGVAQAAGSTDFGAPAAPICAPPPPPPEPLPTEASAGIGWIWLAATGVVVTLLIVLAAVWVVWASKRGG